MPFPEAFLEELSSRCDIYDVVSRYVTLKKSGANWFGLCPFHGEKTASFSINTEKQIYHCFGCGVGGSVFNFIMQIENLTFPESVEFLANSVGMEVPHEDFHDNRKRLLELNKDAARWFREQLLGEGGAAARSYFQKRGLKPSTINHFGLGWAPDTWDSLTKAMTDKGYTKSELLQVNLVKPGKNGGVYDQFRGRVMFPIIDIRGQVIAFGGRIMEGDGPKYLNSQETKVFSKGNNLFALNFAKKNTGRRFILAEGYMDVVALHQAGFTQAVASLGTSLTEGQAKLMKRFADEVVISYDADSAGQNAAARASEILKRQELKIKILKIPGAKDPDEFIRENGAEAFTALLERSEDHMDFVLERILGQCDMTTDEGRVSFLKQAAANIARMPSPIEREIYSSKAAETGNVSKESLMQEVARLRKSYAAKQKNDEKKKILEPTKSAQPADRTLRYKDVRTAKAEEGVISLTIQNPALSSKLSESGIGGNDFSSPFLGKIYGIITDLISRGLTPTSVVLAQHLEPAEMDEVGRILSAPSSGDAERAIEDYIHIILESKAKSGSDDEQLLRLAKLKKKQP